MNAIETFERLNLFSIPYKNFYLIIKLIIHIQCLLYKCSQLRIFFSIYLEDIRCSLHEMKLSRRQCIYRELFLISRDFAVKSYS